MIAPAALAGLPDTDLPAWVTGLGRVASEGPLSSQLRARVSRPHQDALVVAVDGDIDAATIEYLQQVLWPRLSAAVGTVVVELTGVGFLGVAGLQLLHHAHLWAQQRGIAVGLVLGGGEAARAVHVAGLNQDVPCFPAAEHALRVLDGRA